MPGGSTSPTDDIGKSGLRTPAIVEDSLEDNPHQITHVYGDFMKNYSY